MKKVAILVLNNFTNDSRVLKIATSLGKSAYSPTVVAMKDGDVEEHERRKFINVHRIRLSLMLWPRWANALKFMEWTWKVVRQYRKFEVFHCCDFETLPVGVIARWFNPKLVIVYDAHEFEAERLGLSGWRKSFIRYFEKRWIKKTNAVINVSHGISTEYERQFRMPVHDVIFNAPAFAAKPNFNNSKEEKFGFRKDQTVFLYSGGFALGRGIETLLKTFTARKDDKAVMVFLGHGHLEKLIKEQASKHPNIYYHPSVPYEEVVKKVSQADYGMLSTENTCLNNYYCMPNKLFEYIQARIPILVAELKDCQDVVEEEQIGFAGDDASPEGWNKLIDKALETDPASFSSNLEKASEKYNWENEEIKLLELYAKALNQR